jgi:hypothetical protein
MEIKTQTYIMPKTNGTYSSFLNDCNNEINRFLFTPSKKFVKNIIPK